MSSPPPPPMDLPAFSVGGDDPVTAPFEWSEFLDLTFDEQLFLSLGDSSSRQVEEPAELPPPPAPPQPEEEADAVEPLTDRVRKRDPRLVCSNFLAGIVPCACPEMDAKMAEQEEKGEGGPWKKRVRIARGAKGRCQVPDCTADISELKGYHRRHRVCLACANATSVVFDGESKRYCQQCGKFHILADFDEGKRSCRRKLERHNNRRRRKPINSRGANDTEIQLGLPSEDIVSDEESRKGNLCSTSQSTDGGVLQGSNGGNMPNPFTDPDSKVILSDSGVTFTASGETQVDGGNDESKYVLSPSYYDSKSGYSSVCPTGRISFKLYDWNPAEFPRRLRLQIFQWLANMPVELEGYIRPGCTILTAFISMPQFMWVKLFEDPASYVHNFLAPGRALSGRGTALVYVNNMVFRVLRDGMSVVEANVAKQAPKVHYVHPSCFEAGKPMEFIVCGSNLFQPNFRSLVSFSGKYLDHEYSVAFPNEKIDAETSMSFDHQFCRICVRFTDPKFYGPAFIEIENESGLSNFMPIIICDEQVCSEIKMIQEEHISSVEITPCIEAEPPHYIRQAACLGQAIFSNFMLDVAWLLKQPAADKLRHVPTSSEIQRFAHLLSFLVRRDSVYILNRILGCMESVADQLEVNITNRVVDTDRKLLQEQLDQARKYLCQKLKIDWQASTSVRKGSQFSDKFFEDDAVTVPIEQKVLDIRVEGNLITSGCSTSTLKDQTIPLLNKEVAVDMVEMKHQLKESCSLIRSRPSIVVMVAFAVCFGVCTVLVHPSHVSRIVVSIKRCLFEYSI